MRARGKGYLYELDVGGFDKVSNTQWVCDKQVIPIKIIEINVDDYLHLFRYASDKEMLTKLEQER